MLHMETVAIRATLETEIPEHIREEIETFELEVQRMKREGVPEDIFKAFRLQHGIYGQRQSGVQMVRIKIPLGVLSADQLRVLADCAEEYSDGIGHVTTRQDVQLHWVDLDRVGDVMRRLAAVGLTTREACGNTVRNVTACHRAGVCREELFDVTAWAKAVSAHLLRNPVCQTLPRKFKIAFSGCGTKCGLCMPHIKAYYEETHSYLLHVSPFGALYRGTRLKGVFLSAISSVRCHGCKFSEFYESCHRTTAFSNLYADH